MCLQFINCWWPSPAQWFSGPNHVGLVAIFCRLRFKTFQFRGPGLRTFVPQWEDGQVTQQRHRGFLSSPTTSSLRPVSSWRQAPWGSRPDILFSQLNPCSHSPYVTSLLTWTWFCQLWKYFSFVKRTYCTYSMLLKSVSSALYQVLYRLGLRTSVMTVLFFATTAACHLNGHMFHHRQI
jgi:hypothetical protein